MSPSTSLTHLMEPLDGRDRGIGFHLTGEVDVVALLQEARSERLAEGRYGHGRV